MGETTNQIEAHIESTRDNLGSNLHELERKVKLITDWKQHFQTNPMTMLGVAFGGGILLATMMGGRRSRRSERSLAASEPRAGTDHQKHKAMETWDNIKGALIGVAATRFKDFVGEVIPGFHEQFNRTEEKAKTA
jgi:alpha-acetolactate decarboxylase